MRVVIIEDEKAAIRNLAAILGELNRDIKIIKTLDSINETIEWFSVNPMPELIFMDIHLADGSAFEIFDHTHITCPIIFTTAYDEYALRAFKVNSIDYLLKPIDRIDVQKALAKFEELHQSSPLPHTFHDSTLEQLMRSLKKKESYRTHFLIPMKGDKLFPIAIYSILYFYIKDTQIKAVLSDGGEYPISQTLDELTDSIDPSRFFRVNRQFLISREAIRDIDLWFNSRLSINLKNAPGTDKILVSKVKVTEFKEWFSSATYSDI